MLFVYYILARNEEWRMKIEVPDIYEAYMKDTPMFIPGEPGGKIFQSLFGWIKPKAMGIFTAYVVSLVLAMSVAAGVRNYTVSQLPVVSEKDMTLLSVFPREEWELKELYDTLNSSARVKPLLEEIQPNLAYIFPGDYFLTAIVTDEDRRFSDDIIERFPEVIEWHEHKFRGGLGKFFKIFYNFVSTLGNLETDYDVERFVFVRVTDPLGTPVPQEYLFATGMRRRAVLIVDVDSYSEEIITVIQPSGSHKWGTMPMPTF